ncbi:MAG: two-component system chemotaxis family response regulator CheY [Halothiobacillaceae bacterium]|nr:MAG: two-component system chemotaxis family response regulator CheY [Halothiobacillaceae bacterium]
MPTLTIDRLVVLLVEPSPTQHKIITGHLHALGIRHIDWTQTAQDTLERLRQCSPDLIISAMHLPDMPGSELLQTIRESSALLDIPFILISSETGVRYLNPMRQAGVTAILPKPYQLDQLKKALYTTIDFLDPEVSDFDEEALSNIKVLLVDDSLTSRHQIKRLLNNMGIADITEAANGKEGVETIETHYFDLVITDYNMPEMDGRELIEHIRNTSKQPGVPILMITSESDQSRLAAVEQSGVSAICDKPFEPDIIKRILKTAVLGME